MEIDLTKLGYRELELVQKILKSYLEYGIPGDKESLKGIYFEEKTGDLSVISETDRYLILDDERLVDYLATPVDGHEGTITDLLDQVGEEWCEEDLVYLRDYIQGYLGHSDTDPCITRLNRIIDRLYK